MIALVRTLAMVVWLCQFPTVKAYGRKNSKFRATVVLPDEDHIFRVRWCGGAGHPIHRSESAALKCGRRQLKAAW